VDAVKAQFHMVNGCLECRDCVSGISYQRRGLGVGLVIRLNGFVGEIKKLLGPRVKVVTHVDPVLVHCFVDCITTQLIFG